MTRLDEIEARIADATPGPWEADVFPVRKRSRKTGRVLAYRPEDGTVGSVSVIPSDGVYGVMDGPDAELIAHAPTDLTALLAVVKALRTKAEGWAALAPDDDWGEDIAQTIVADAGRSILATLDAALSEPEQP